MTTKLTYFDIYGRGEAIRLLLAHAKVDYEDNVITREQLADLKASGALEFGQVPLLERDGLKLVQSWSILRYLGSQLGYYPSDPEVAYEIDSTLEGVEDFIGKYFRPIFEQDVDKKASYLQDLLTHITLTDAAIEQTLQNNESKLHIVGNTTTIADIALANVAFSLVGNPAGPFYEQIAPLVKEGTNPLTDAYFKNLAEQLGSRLESRGPRPF